MKLNQSKGPDSTFWVADGEEIAQVSNSYYN